mmetsp:Transcript_80989/g.127524  ORF Transcript_80989/g.127524 Transcript_80989/m.127524 type:complete len:84 (-) Transcript_80989:152-403(-)
MPTAPGEAFSTEEQAFNSVKHMKPNRFELNCEVAIKPFSGSIEATVASYNMGTRFRKKCILQAKTETVETRLDTHASCHNEIG